MLIGCRGGHLLPYLGHHPSGGRGGPDRPPPFTRYTFDTCQTTNPRHPTFSSDGPNAMLSGVTFGNPTQFSEWSDDEMAELDHEGRAVMTDHGGFVLINLYGPALSMEDNYEERFRFKLRFYEVRSGWLGAVLTYIALLSAGLSMVIMLMVSGLCRL
eukprot:scaffold5913_cov34-Prasinocladus_malaysianus.AAC.2